MINHTPPAPQRPNIINPAEAFANPTRSNMAVNYRLPKVEGKRYASTGDVGYDGVGQPQTPTIGICHLDPAPVHCDPLALPPQPLELPEVLDSQDWTTSKKKKA